MRLLDNLVSDTRYALRSFGRAPVFTLVAFLTLAVGIACVTSVFSVIDTAALRPLPYPEARRTVALSEERFDRRGYYQLSITAARALRGTSRSFEYVGLYDPTQLALDAGGSSETIQVTAVDSSIFPMLAIAPERGRTIAPEEIRTGARVVVIGDALWRSRFGGSDRVLGATVRIGRDSYTLIGVMPPEFSFPVRSEAWVPLQEKPDSVEGFSARDYEAIARLRPGVTKAQARAELALVAAQLARADQVHYRRLTFVMRDDMVDRGTAAVMRFGGLFLAAASLVLLVACSNVGNLYLIRAAERRGEMAVRASLGASRARLVQQSLTESLLLAGVAAVAGAFLSVWCVRLVLSVVPTQGFPKWMRFGLDWRVLAFAAVVALIVTAAFGLLPAREGTRVDLTRALKAGGDAATGGTRRRDGRRGIALQLALACALLVAAMLLWQSYERVATLRRGYDVDHLLAAYVPLPSERYPDALARSAFLEEMMSRLAHEAPITGVSARGQMSEWLDSVAARRVSPAVKARLSTNAQDWELFLPGQSGTSPEDTMFPRVDHVAVTPGYFTVLGIPLLRGRAFDVRDGPGAPYAAVVSRRLAAELWPHGDAVGRLVRVGVRGAFVEVVGVVGDVRQMITGTHGGRIESTVSDRPTLYLCARQMGTMNPQVIVRTGGDPALLAADVRAVARAMDPEVVPFGRTMREEARIEALGPESVGAIFGAFALCALGLAVIGTYGVIGYDVRQRRREIGIRLALGATARGISALVVQESMRYATVGLIGGLLLAVALSRGLRFMLVDASGGDAMTYLSVLGALAVVAVVACWLPARRVATVDPATALRAE